MGLVTARRSFLQMAALLAAASAAEPLLDSVKRVARLLLSTGSRWLRYDGDPSLSGDALVRDLASRPPAFWGDWRQEAAPAGNEAIAWFPPPRRPGQPAAVASSFLALAESGLFRWLPPATPGRLDA
jgi:hypothetical protein